MSDIKPLWPGGHVIPVIGVTGGFGTGKTKFLLSIARPDRTRIYDLEMSSADCAEYEKHGLDRIDVAKELFDLYPNGYTPKQYFLWWLKHIKDIKPGRFDAILVDPANELENGLVDWVAGRYANFKYKSEDNFRSMKGVFQGTVKDEWKRVKVDLAQRCQTFGFANHMRGVWRDGESTGEKEAKGKESFFALAGLYLEMFWDAEDKQPRAKVLKSRLDHTIFDEDGMVDEIIPIIRKGQILPVASPKAIRNYIKNPVGKRALKKEEKELPAKPLSEDEKLQLKARIVSSEAKKAELDSENLAAATKLEEQKEKVLDKKEQARAAALAGLMSKPSSKKEESANSSLGATKELLEAAEKKGVKERVVNALQKDLGVKVTGKLTPVQARKVTPELLKKYTDGLSKVKTKAGE